MTFGNIFEEIYRSHRGTHTYISRQWALTARINKKAVSRMKDRFVGSFVIVRNCSFEYLLGATYFSFSTGGIFIPLLATESNLAPRRFSRLGKVAHALSILLVSLFLLLSFLFLFFLSPLGLLSWSQRVDCCRVAGGCCSESDVLLMAVTHSRVPGGVHERRRCTALAHNYQSPKHAVC